MLGKCQGTSTGLMAIKEWDNDALSPLDLEGYPIFKQTQVDFVKSFRWPNLAATVSSKTEPPMFA